jgi:hypothetical protein
MQVIKCRGRRCASESWGISAICPLGERRRSRMRSSAHRKNGRVVSPKRPKSAAKPPLTLPRILAHQTGSMWARHATLLGTAHSRLKFGPTRRSALQAFALQVSSFKFQVSGFRSDAFRFLSASRRLCGRSWKGAASKPPIPHRRGYLLFFECRKNTKNKR